MKTLSKLAIVLVSLALISCGGGGKKTDQTKTSSELAPVDTSGAASGDWINLIR
jgi:hypothetical protein